MSKAYAAFQLKSDTYQQALQQIAVVRKGGDLKSLNHDFGQMLMQLVDEGMECYFHQPLNQIRVGKTVRKSANAGMSAATRAMHVLIRNLFKKMTHKQLLSFADYVESMLIANEDGRTYLGLPLEEDLQQEIEAIIKRVHEDPNTDAYAHWVVENLIKMLDVSKAYYYDKPVALAELGMITRKTADLAVSTAMKATHAVIKQLFKKTRQKEMIQFADFLQSVIVYHEASQPASVANT